MRRIVRLGIAALLGGSLVARGGEQAASRAVAKSMAQVAEEIEGLLSQDRIHSQFDLFRKLKDYGVTYQPALLAPNDRVGRLDDVGLRQYAGVKLFDAVYAAAFRQRQDLKDCAQVMDMIENKLDVRSCADIGNEFFVTLNQAAMEPEAVDVRDLLEQLSKDYVANVPALLAHPESAEYLIEGLFGFTVEMYYLLAYFYQHDTDDKLRAGIDQYDGMEWLDAMRQVFEAFDQLDEGTRKRAETTARLAVIRQMITAIKGRMSGTITGPALADSWRKTAEQIGGIRKSILFGGHP